MGLKKEVVHPYYTYDDYRLWEGEWELIYGSAYAMSPAPMITHQSISAKIARQLDELFQECSKCKTLLPVDWKIAEDTVVQPDNLVICHEPRNPAYISQAPVIIFEILSKSTAKKDETVKFDLYEREGVKYYILVNPDEKVAKAYQLKDGKYIKLIDTYDETIKFEITKCKSDMEFDFSKIW